MSVITEFMTGTGITALANFLGIFATLIAAVFSVWNWQSDRTQKAFNEALVRIELVPDSGVSYSLTGKIRRKNLIRAEVQGMIGAIPRFKKELYKIAFLHNPVFYERLERAQSEPDQTVIQIQCTQGEMDQFDLTFGCESS